MIYPGTQTRGTKAPTKDSPCPSPWGLFMSSPSLCRLRYPAQLSVVQRSPDRRVLVGSGTFGVGGWMGTEGHREGQASGRGEGMRRVEVGHATNPFPGCPTQRRSQTSSPQSPALWAVFLAAVSPYPSEEASLWVTTDLCPQGWGGSGGIPGKQS